MQLKKTLFSPHQKFPVVFSNLGKKKMNFYFFPIRLYYYQHKEKCSLCLTLTLPAFWEPNFHVYISYLTTYLTSDHKKKMWIPSLTKISCSDCKKRSWLQIVACRYIFAKILLRYKTILGLLQDASIIFFLNPTI